MQMRSLFVLTILSLLSSPAMAGDLICKYPKECIEPIGSKYSTGGGKAAIQLDCKTKDGHMVSYIDEMGSLSGLFGLGRLTMPDRITYKTHDKLKMECKSK